MYDRISKLFTRQGGISAVAAAVAAAVYAEAIAKATAEANALAARILPVLPVAQKAAQTARDLEGPVADAFSDINIVSKHSEPYRLPKEVVEGIMNKALSGASQKIEEDKASPTDDTECARQLDDYSLSTEIEARAIVRLRLDEKLLPHLTPAVPSGFTPLAMFQSIKEPQEARNRVIEEWFQLRVIDSLLAKGADYFCTMPSASLTDLATTYFGKLAGTLAEGLATKIQGEAKEFVGKELLKKTKDDAEYVERNMPTVYKELVDSKQQFALASHYANLGRALRKEQLRPQLSEKTLTPTFCGFPASASNTIAIINQVAPL